MDMGACARVGAHRRQCVCHPFLGDIFETRLPHCNTHFGSHLHLHHYSHFHHYPLPHGQTNCNGYASSSLGDGFRRADPGSHTDLPPTFQDDFGASSAGWQSEEWCGYNIDYVQGELVITKCRAFRPNISYNDFVVELDVRFLPGGEQNERFSFSFKDISGIGDGHVVSI